MLVFSRIARGDQPARRYEQVFQRAHGQAVGQRTSFVNDFPDRAALIARLSLFDEIAILENSAAVDKQRNLPGDSHGFSGLQIAQRDRMTAARIHAEFDVNTADLLPLFLENRFQLV